MKFLLHTISVVLTLCSVLVNTSIFSIPIQLPGHSLKNPELETKWQESISSGWFYEGEDLYRGVEFYDKDIIVSSWVSNVLITCSADYPVHWSYAVAEDLQDVYHSIFPQSHRISEVYEDPFTYRYYSYMSLNGFGRRITGNYTCTSATDESLQANRYIFWAETNRNLIYGEVYEDSSGKYGGQATCKTPSCNGRPSKTVMADSANQTIILPCSVCQPDATVTLTKRNASNNTVYDEIKLTNDSITFNPKLGFILKVQELSSPYGIYKCEGYKSNETVIVNATTGITMPQFVSENNTLDTNAKYYFENKTTSIVCCSSGTKPPKIYIKDCPTKYDCKKVKLELRDFQHIDRQESISRTATARNCRSTTIGGSDGRSGARRGYSYGRRTNTGAFRCFGVGIDVTRDYFYVPAQSERYPHHIWHRGGHYSNGGGNSGMDSGKNDSKLYIGDEISNLPKEDLITVSTSRGSVEQDALNAILSNQTVTLHCHPSIYFFSYGVRWSIVWKNHTTQIQPLATEPNRMGSQILDIDSLAKLEVLVTEEMLSIVCHAPLHDSSKWVNKTLTINITKPIPPKIEGPSEETFVWSPGDTNKELICKADGIPKPVTFSWTYPWSNENPDFFGRKSAGRGVQPVQEDGCSKIKLIPVLENHFGKYICTVTTEAGTAVKIFIVARPGSKEAGASTTTTSIPKTTPASLKTESEKNSTKSDADAKPAHLVVGRDSNSSSTADGESGPAAATNVGLIATLGVVSFALIICGIGLIVLAIKMRKQQTALERVSQPSYYNLNDMGQAQNNSVHSDDDE